MDKTYIKTEFAKAKSVFELNQIYKRIIEEQDAEYISSAMTAWQLLALDNVTMDLYAVSKHKLEDEVIGTD